VNQKDVSIAVIKINERVNAFLLTPSRVLKALSFPVLLLLLLAHSPYDSVSYMFHSRKKNKCRDLDMYLRMLLYLSKIYLNFSLLPLILCSFSLIAFSYLYHVSVMPYFSPFSCFFFSLRYIIISLFMNMRDAFSASSRTKARNPSGEVTEKNVVEQRCCRNCTSPLDSDCDSHSLLFFFKCGI
jgi:hypothetical protein